MIDLKDEIREILTYIKDRKETLSKYPVTRQGESNIEMKTGWIDKKVSEVRNYLSNTACVTPPIEAVYREFTKFDLYDATDGLCMRNVITWHKYESPKRLWGALTILDRWVEPPPIYDCRTHGPDGLSFAKSDSKVGRIYRHNMKMQMTLKTPMVRVAKTIGPPAADPERWERRDKRNAEEAERRKEAKEKAIAEIKKELARRGN